MENFKKDLYEILKVNKKASINEIKKNYRNLSKKYHPDINKNPDANQKFSRLSSAYLVLSNKDKRSKYDTTGQEEHINNEESEAVGLISNFFQKFLTKDYMQNLNGSYNEISYIPLIKSNLMENEATFETSLKQLKNILSFLKKQRKKIIQKNKTNPDLFFITLEKMITSHQKSIETAEKEIKVLKLALKMLESYKEKKISTSTAFNHFAKTITSTPTSTSTSTY